MELPAVPGDTSTVTVTVETTSDERLRAELERALKDTLIESQYDSDLAAEFLGYVRQGPGSLRFSTLQDCVHQIQNTIKSKSQRGKESLSRREKPAKDYVGNRELDIAISPADIKDHITTQRIINNELAERYVAKKKYHNFAVGDNVATMHGDLALVPLARCSLTSDRMLASVHVSGYGTSEGESRMINIRNEPMSASGNAVECHPEFSMLNEESRNHRVTVRLGDGIKWSMGPHTIDDSLPSYNISLDEAEAQLNTMRVVEMDVNYMGSISPVKYPKSQAQHGQVILGQFTVVMTNNSGQRVNVRAVAKVICSGDLALSALLQDIMLNEENSEAPPVVDASFNPFLITVKSHHSSNSFRVTGERLPLSSAEYLAIREGKSENDPRGAPFVKSTNTGSIVDDNVNMVASDFDPYTNMSWEQIEAAISNTVLPDDALVRGGYPDQQVEFHSAPHGLDTRLRYNLKASSLCRTNFDLEDGIENISVADRRAIEKSFVQWVVKRNNSLSTRLTTAQHNGSQAMANMVILLRKVGYDLFVGGNVEVLSSGPRSNIRRVVKGYSTTDANGNAIIVHSDGGELTQQFPGKTFTSEDCLIRNILSLITKQTVTHGNVKFPPVHASQVMSSYINTPICVMQRYPLDMNAGPGIGVYPATATIVANLFDRSNLNLLGSGFSRAGRYISSCIRDGHKGAAGYPSQTHPFCFVKTGLCMDEGDMSSTVSVYVGNYVLGVDCLIQDCLRSIMHTIQDIDARGERKVQERVFTFYHHRICLLFCVPDRLKPSHNQSVVFINFAPRKSRTTKLIKSSSNVVPLLDDESRVLGGILHNTVLFENSRVTLEGYYEHLPGEVTI